MQIAKSFIKMNSKISKNIKFSIILLIKTTISFLKSLSNQFIIVSYDLHKLLNDN